LYTFIRGVNKKTKETYVLSLRQRQLKFFPRKSCIVTWDKMLVTSYSALARSLCALKPQTAPLAYHKYICRPSHFRCYTFSLQKYDYKFTTKKNFKFYKFISKRTIISLMHLASFHGTLFGFVNGLYIYSISDFNIFGLSMIQETSIVNMSIWCIKIAIVWILHSIYHNFILDL
jgi:hypothetical protein